TPVHARLRPAIPKPPKRHPRARLRKAGALPPGSGAPIPSRQAGQRLPGNMGDERDHEHPHHVSGRRRKGAAPAHRYPRNPPPAITCQCHFPLRLPASTRYLETKKLSVSSIEEEVWWWNQQTRPKSLSNRQLPFARIAIPGGVAAAPVPALPKATSTPSSMAATHAAKPSSSRPSCRCPRPATPSSPSASATAACPDKPRKADRK